MTVEDRLKKAFITGLDVLGINALMRPWYSGVGVIFALHRVVEPGTPVLLTGNVITTSFLDEVLRYVKRTQWDIIPLSEVCLRLNEGSDRPFVCFTFDDGYA